MKVEVGELAFGDFCVDADGDLCMKSWVDATGDWCLVCLRTGEPFTPAHQSMVHRLSRGEAGRMLWEQAL